MKTKTTALTVVLATFFLVHASAQGTSDLKKEIDDLKARVTALEQENAKLKREVAILSQEARRAKPAKPAEETQTLRGKYYQNEEWIEFRSNGKVFVNESDDVADFSVDGDSILISHVLGGATGKILSSTEIEFPKSTGIVGKSFSGKWVKK